MRLAIVAAIAAFAPATADAHPCHGFVFYGEGPFCPQQGRGYWAPMLRFELGAYASTLVVDGEDAATTGLSPGVADARGGRFRFLWGGHGFYLGGEVSYARFEPRARAIFQAVGGETSGPDATGRTLGIDYLAGYRQTTWRVSYGLGVAGGVRSLGRIGATEEDEYAAQGVVDVRAHLGAWLTPFTSISLEAGQSLLRREEHLMMVSFAVSVFAWDGLR